MKTRHQYYVTGILFALTTLLLNACGSETYTVGGKVTGLSSIGLVLQNNGGDDLEVTGASFQFATVLADSSGYDVTVLTQPTGQNCDVIDGNGTINRANVSDITAVCHDRPPAGLLAWPIDCIPGETCTHLGYPDIDKDGKAFNCAQPGYKGHEGTDISITWDQMDSGASVSATADGQVLWVFDGKYDRCPDDAHPDCQAPPDDWWQPGQSNGYRVCTKLGNYCGTGQDNQGKCFWCFDGGNVVVIRHNTGKLFATRYDHLKKNSIIVAAGQTVSRGEKIAEVGSAGNSTGPHLHFEVWGTKGFMGFVDPWKGECGPNFDDDYWINQPSWMGDPIGFTEISEALL